jgi:flagellar hook-length control protein FliK
MSAAAPPRGLTQTPADASDAAAGKVAVSQDPELPPVIDRSVRAPQVHADLQPGAAATMPVMSPANAEADRAARETSAARAEATVALSSASIGSATPPAMREAPAIMQAIDRVVASPGWQEDVAQKLTHFVSLRATTAEIRLNPADLGPIGVTISYADDQATVMITAAQPATRDALEQALPHLKEMLAQQGITLSEAGVRDRRESMPQWAEADPRRGYSDRRDDAPGARTDTAAGSAPAATRTPRLIDTFA